MTFIAFKRILIVYACMETVVQNSKQYHLKISVKTLAILTKGSHLEAKK